MAEIESLKPTVLTMPEADVKALILYETRIKSLFNSFKTAQKMMVEENK